MSCYRFIHAEEATWSVRLMCRVLGVARSADHDWRRAEPRRRERDDVALTVHIKAIHRRSRGTYGSPRVHTDAIAPNLLERDFHADRPNTVWVGDITYLTTAEGWVYLVILLDLHSRKVIGWALDEHMRTELCLEALSRAVAVRQPARGLIHHTDRGSQYASDAYRSALKNASAVASMSRKGDCWDNARGAGPTWARASGCPEAQHRLARIDA